jgi:hypothetical protein
MASVYNEKFITESLKLWIPVEKYLFQLPNKSKGEHNILARLTNFIGYLEDKYKNEDVNNSHYELYVHFPPKFTSSQEQIVKTKLLVDLDYFTQIEKKYHHDKYRSIMCDKGSDCFFPLSCKYAHQDVINIIINSIQFQTYKNPNPKNITTNPALQIDTNLSNQINPPSSTSNITSTITSNLTSPANYTNSSSLVHGNNYSSNISKNVIETANKINRLSKKKKRKAELLDDYDQLSGLIDKKYDEIQILKDKKYELKKKIYNYEDDIEILEKNIGASSKLLVDTNSEAITFLNSIFK